MLSKAKIKQVHALELKKHRDEQQAFVAEGTKTVIDLMGTFACEWIAARPEWFDAHAYQLSDGERIEADRDELRRASLLKSPPEVIAVFRRREERLLAADPTREWVIALDGVQDPGNLGTITWLHLTALLMQAMRVAIPAVIVASTVGTDSVKHMLDSIPPVVTGGLNVAGGMIVVVGYAMVINMMRAPHLMMFFFVGFVVAAFTNFNLVALGVLGVALAYFYIQMHPKYHKGLASAGSVSSGGRSKLDDQLD